MIRYVSDAGTREVNLRLKSVIRRSRPDGSHPPPKFELARSYVPEVRELLDTLAKRPVPSLKDARRAAAGFVDASISERRYVDGVLACLELSFQTGDDNYANQLMKRVRQAAGRDAKTMQFFDAIGRDSRAIRKVRESPRFVGYKKLHVLDYLLGDKLLAEGAADEAYRSLKTALAGNPLLVSAYVDLGRIQMGQFDSTSAWELFQAAKQIAPAHSDLAPILRLEEQLEDDFPDHF